MSPRALSWLYLCIQTFSHVRTNANSCRPLLSHSFIRSWLIFFLPLNTLNVTRKISSIAYFAFQFQRIITFCELNVVTCCRWVTLKWNVIQEMHHMERCKWTNERTTERTLEVMLISNRRYRWCFHTKQLNYFILSLHFLFCRKFVESSFRSAWRVSEWMRMERHNFSMFVWCFIVVTLVTLFCVFVAKHEINLFRT